MGEAKGAAKCQQTNVAAQPALRTSMKSRLAAFPGRWAAVALVTASLLAALAVAAAMSIPVPPRSLLQNGIDAVTRHLGAVAVGATATAAALVGGAGVFAWKRLAR